MARGRLPGFIHVSRSAGYRNVALLCLEDVCYSELRLWLFRLANKLELEKGREGNREKEREGGPRSSKEHETGKKRLPVSVFSTGFGVRGYFPEIAVSLRDDCSV